MNFRRRHHLVFIIFTLVASTQPVQLHADEYEDLLGISSKRSGLYLAGTYGHALKYEITSSDIFSSSNEFLFNMDDADTFSGAVGFYLGPARVEVEASYMETDYDRFGSPFGTVGVSGDLDYFTVGANLFYDFPTPVKGLDLYLGAGAGVARLRGQGNLDSPITFVDGFGNPIGTLDSVNDSLHTFTYQFMAGLSYEVIDNVTLTGGYRLRLFGETSNNSLENFAFDYREHHINIFEVGVRIDF